MEGRKDRRPSLLILTSHILCVVLSFPCRYSDICGDGTDKNDQLPVQSSALAPSPSTALPPPPNVGNERTADLAPPAPPAPPLELPIGAVKGVSRPTLADRKKRATKVTA
jgi:hypothetical protein